MQKIVSQRGTEPRAASCRNTGRHHLGMPGRLRRRTVEKYGPQSRVVPNSRYFRDLAVMYREIARQTSDPHAAHSMSAIAARHQRGPMNRHSGRSRSPGPPSSPRRRGDTMARRSRAASTAYGRASSAAAQNPNPPGAASSTATMRIANVSRHAIPDSSAAVFPSNSPRAAARAAIKAAKCHWEVDMLGVRAA
jgi:hypothetical protein